MVQLVGEHQGAQRLNHELAPVRIGENSQQKINHHSNDRHFSCQEMPECP